MIAYCLANVDEDARAKLATTGAREYSCVGACGLCAREPFVLADDTVVTGVSHADVLRDIPE